MNYESGSRDSNIAAFPQTGKTQPPCNPNTQDARGKHRGGSRAAQSDAARAAERVNGPLSAQAHWKNITSIGLNVTIKVSTTKSFLLGILEKVTFEEIILLPAKQV